MRYIHTLDSYLNNQLYIQRDDLLPFSFGGNKARKSFLFFQEIRKGNYDYVVTYGSSESNHCRVIANMCTKYNYPCIIISPKEIRHNSMNMKLIQMMKAEVIYCELSKVKECIASTMQSLESKGYHPYFIQGGGHGNLGTKAYVQAYEEIKEYEKEHHVFFDYIFFASGTGTTQAGLECGKLLHKDKKREIVGISIARKEPYGKQVILESIKDYFEEYHQGFSVPNDITFIDDYTGNGYGTTNKEIEDTIKNAYLTFGIPLDKTYTGKAFYGMREYIRKNSIINKNILFIHTGGTPLFFDYLEEQND